MLRVPINLARPGMRLATEVLHPQRGNVLLKWGFLLERPLIEKLKDLGIREVWVQYPGTDEIRESISPAILQKRSDVVAVIADLFARVHRGAHVDLPFDNYSKVLRELIESVTADSAASSYIIEMGGSADSGLRHCSEVCFLSILLGLKLQSYLIHQRRRLSPTVARDIIGLALGAMLHDVGYVALDEAVRKRYDATRDESDAAWQEHVTAGHRLVSGSIRPAAAGVILQHHQNFDGSGFPQEPDALGNVRGLSGEEIHVFARIVSVANTFDRLLYPPDGATVPRVRVLNQMLNGPLAARFDPVVLAALPLVAPAYPPGAVARLSNGELVVVVKWYPAAPCRPTVQPLGEDAFDKATEDIEPPAEQYDLRERPDLLIAEQDGIDVRADNFEITIDPEHAEHVSGAPTTGSQAA